MLLSRRTALLGTAAVASFAAPLAMAELRNGVAVPDDGLAALKRRFWDADKAWSAAIRATENAEIALKGLFSGPDRRYVSPRVRVGRYLCLAEDDILDRAEPHLGHNPSPDEVEKALASFRRQAVIYQNARKQYGLDKYDDAERAAEEYCDEVEGEFEDAIPTTFEGVAAKLRYVIEWAEIGDNGRVEEAARTALKGLEQIARLSGEASS